MKVLESIIRKVINEIDNNQYDPNYTDEKTINKIEQSIQSLYKSYGKYPKFSDIENVVKKYTSAYRIKKSKATSGSSSWGVKIFFNDDSTSLPNNRATLYSISE